MNCSIYSRVSTDRQDTQNQLVELREYAAKQGWNIVSEFVDTATGGTSDREAFQRMLQSAERREFDTLLFWSLDRLTREGTLETLQHLKRLEKAGVGFRSMTESYLDSAGIMKDVVMALLATMAKQEKVRISERTKAGLAVAKANGRKLGRRVVSIDFDRFAQLKSEGKSAREISRTLDVPLTTIRRRLVA